MTNHKGLDATSSFMSSRNGSRHLIYNKISMLAMTKPCRCSAAVIQLPIIAVIMGGHAHYGDQ